MDPNAIYTKTAKGLAEAAKHRRSLPRECYAILLAVDGRCDLGQLRKKADGLAPEVVDECIWLLLREDLVRPLSATPEENLPPLVSSDMQSTELDPEEGVREWAAARRAARTLKENGYFANSRAGYEHAGPPDVLVVEDDPVIAQMEQSLLRRAGYEVRHAASGREADAQLAAVKPDLVVLDVVLPDTTGFDILRRLRADPAYRDLPVIMVTAQVGPEDIRRGLRDGADGYIFKPFRAETLVDCLRKVLAS